MTKPMNLPPLKLKRLSSEPLFRQLYGEIRSAILSGALTPGMQLPPSRTLAAQLGVSRQTVVNAYEQLIAEGYFICTVGRGSFVSELPVRQRRGADLPRRDPTVGVRPLSTRSQAFVDPRIWMGEHVGPPRAFRTGTPALELFPFALWARLEARRWRRPPVSLCYSDPAGYLPLRELLAVHLRVTRGVHCDPAQILVTSGTQQSMHLVAQLLLNPGDQAWVENPGYRGALAALRTSGVEAVPVAVDSEGLRVDDGVAAAPRARLACVTPSHQYPLGVTMSLARRLALLNWAERQQAWILEDDYDSEYRYEGPVLASLKSLDRAGSVLYIGTLSKSLLPGLRLSYLVVPPALVDAFAACKTAIDRMTPVMPQVVLADFIAGGHFGRQVRRTREAYGERRQVLLNELASQLGGQILPGPSQAGLQLAVAFQPGIDDQAFARAAERVGVEVRALSGFYSDADSTSPQPRASGLLLGFSCVPPRNIRLGVAALGTLLPRARSEGPGNGQPRRQGTLLKT